MQLPLTTPGVIPTDLVCTNGQRAAPVLRCGVGVATGTDAWECMDRAGNAVAVTQGTGTTYEAGPWGRAARITTQAAAPKIEAATATALGLDRVWTGDYTAVAYGLPTKDVSNFPRFFGHGAWAASGAWMEIAGGYFACTEMRAGVGFTQSVTATPIGERGIAACRKAGSALTARIGGVTSTGTVTGPVVAPNVPLYFGTYASESAVLGGPLDAVLIYDCALTDDSLARLEASIVGTRASDGRPVTTTRAGPAWVRDSTGAPQKLGDNAAAVEPVMQGPRAAINYVQNSARPDLWNKDTGVAVDCSGADGCVVDHKAWGWVVPGGLSNSYAGPLSITCELKAGTSNYVGVNVDSAGMTPALERWFTLTNTWARYTLSGVTTPATWGSVAYLKGPGTPGNYYVRQCQIEPSPYPTERLDCGATACIRGTPGQGDVQARNHWRWYADPARWTDHYTPTMGATLATAEGPAREIIDDDATAWEGKYSGGTTVTATGKWTLTCEVRAGTVNTALLQFVTNGTSSQNCPITGLTADFQRLSCTTTIGGAPTYTYGYVDVGNVAAVTGSIYARRCQLEPGDVFSGAWIPTADKPAERRSGGGIQSYGTVQPFNANGALPTTWADDAGTLTFTGPDAAGWWTATDNDGAARESKRLAALAGTTTDINGTWTISCEMAPGTLSTARMWFYRSGAGSMATVGGCGTTTISGGQRYAGCTATVSGADATTNLLGIFELGDGTAGVSGTVLVRQCQIEKAATPGRRCDCGPTVPCSCLGDLNTVSTAGWPVASGWCEWDYTPSNTVSDARLLDARNGGNGILVQSLPDQLAFGIYRGGAATFVSAMAARAAGVTQHGRVEWTGGKARACAGSTCSAWIVAAPPSAHAAFAGVGSMADGGLPAAGGIANLRCGRL
jgi:hypothetical protein